MSDRVEMIQKPQYIVAATEAPDFSKLEIFGGSSNILEIQPGETAGPLVHTRIEPQVELSEDFDPTDIFCAKVGKTEYRMPVCASFKNAAIAAELAPGDTYYVRRLENVMGKKGRAKGKDMAIYQIAVKRGNASQDERAEAKRYREEYQEVDAKPTKKKK